MFHFRYEKFDYWPVYDRIKNYYPLGIPKDDTGMYKNYPGLKELEKVIIDNIHDEHNFTSRWENFEKQVEYRTHKIVTGTTSGQTPCYSSAIELERKQTDNLTRIREIHFFVSLTGPFYTVIGKDQSRIDLGDDKVEITNFLAISPVYEYKELFDQICCWIEEAFPGFRFVPYGIYSQRIEGLNTSGGFDDERNAVFSGLFNQQIDLDAKALGNKYFKSRDWLRDDYDADGEGQWTAYPPGISGR